MNFSIGHKIGGGSPRKRQQTLFEKRLNLQEQNHHVIMVPVVAARSYGWGNDCLLSQGSGTPEEIVIYIIGEIISVWRGRRVQSMKDIHNMREG